MIPQAEPPPSDLISPAAPSEPQPGNSASGSRGRVALIEDDVGFRDAVKEFLDENGYEVVIIQSGMDGVNEAIEANCDVILCDMLMPSFSGDMVYRAVEELRPELCDRFVFITAYRGISKFQPFFAQLRGTVLPKPFAMADLLEVIAFTQVRSAVRALT